MEDQLIIELFFERSEQAILELSKKYGALCRSLSMRILHNDQDAEECVNDAFLAAWNTIPPEKPEPLSAYICRITRNLSLKKYHSLTAQKRNSQYDMILEEAAEFLAAKDSVEDELIAGEIAGRINHFLGELRQKDRVIFVQRYWFCKEIPEIAAELGLSKNYVNVRLHRTRERLKKYLRAEGYLL